MPSPLIKNSHGFSSGQTPIISLHDDIEVGLDFSIIKLAGGEHFDLGFAHECAALLLTGDAQFSFDGVRRRVMRASLFDQAPFALHLAQGQCAKIEARTESEFALILTDNDQKFPGQLFDEQTMLENEHRGQGVLNDTAYRIVRTIFDQRNRPTSNLVLGEVITFPGRWSSYPPHFHRQPEIYHYRFTEPQGYGHAELGDDVFKIHHGDTIKIVDEKTHSQVSAPGYGMYYLWAIRHLPGDPYTQPTFVEEHAWTKNPSANARVWRQS